MKRRWLGGLTALLLVLTAVFPAGWGGVRAEEAPEALPQTVVSADSRSYDQYRALNADQPAGTRTVTVPLSTGQPDEKARITLANGWNGADEAVLWDNAAGTVTWPVSVAQAGWYCLAVTYHAREGAGGPVSLSLMVDGEAPFSGCETLTLPRFWRDELEDGEIPRDSSGNEVQPSQSEVLRWETVLLSSADGLYPDAWQFYFSTGEHTLSLTLGGEPVAIGALELCPPESEAAYVRPEGIGTAGGGLVDTVEGEKPALKTDEVLHPVYDRTDAATQPADPYRIRLNTIGGEHWSTAGQWIEWTITVPEDGYYQIGSRFRQKVSQGSPSQRRLRIDGEVPFAECRSLSFSYALGWQTEWFGGEEPYLFYLTAGEHTLRLEVTSGDMAPLIRQLSQTLDSLNAMYRKIVMITSVQPDMSRDYDVDQQIPELIGVLESQAASLRAAAAAIHNGQSTGSQAASLERLAERLEGFVKKPYSIPEQLSGFREELSTLASLLLDLRSQPLELDYLFVGRPGTALPRASAGFFEQFWSDLRSFMASFFMDYDQIGSVDSDRCIDVWMTVGREQANQLRRQIDTDFVEQTGISVRLRLVTVGLVQAVMAGEEPDVALNIARSDPLNLWLRGALAELQDMEGLEEIQAAFSPTAFVPYMTGEALYGLPETQTFDMMFVRTDIFEELGIQPPETWEDLYRVSQIIQRANLEVGLPSTYTLFGALLLQNGGNFFSEDGQTLTTDSAVGQQAFQEWIDFYLEYSFPLNKNEYNRFRTGEMPLAVTSYTLYNQLTAAAPDIRGLWEMLPIPGVRQADGTIDRAEVAGGTACVMLGSSDHKADAWTFMKWWVSADTQAEYGRGVEMALGEAARYTPANQEALERLGWTAAESAKLREQWDSVVDLPEVPGGYYIARNLDNAFRACVYKYSNPREMLNYWTYETNKEIVRKRREFHLDG